MGSGLTLNEGRGRWAEQEECKDMVRGRWEEGSRLIVVVGGSVDGTWSAMRIWGFEPTGEEKGRRWTQRFAPPLF